MKRIRPLLAALAMLALPARADDAQDFYRNRALTLDVGFNTGGAYDVYARLFAKHFPRFLNPDAPPTIVVRNMPGAGSVIATNYLFNRAAMDGGEFGLVAGTAALEPLVGATKTQYDAREFNWLGSANREPGVCFAWATSKVATADDLFAGGMVTGTAGTSSQLVPTMLDNVLDAKLKLVRGYNGTSALMLAVERGEVEGMCGMVWAAVEAEHPDWLAKKLIRPILQIGLEPAPELGDLPLVTRYVHTDEQTRLLRLLVGWAIMGRPFLLPPKAPADRARHAREAFGRMMADADFLADAKASRIGISPITAEAIRAFLDDAYASPADIVAKARTINSASQ